MSDIKIVGQLQYEETSDEKGEASRVELFFVDTPPDSDNMWFITWIAQLEQEEANMSVYLEPTAGSVPQKEIHSATDEEIQKLLGYVSVEQKDEWLRTIEESQDYEYLNQSEKERLMRLIEESK